MVQLFSRFASVTHVHRLFFFQEFRWKLTTGSNSRLQKMDSALQPMSCGARLPWQPRRVSADSLEVRVDFTVERPGRETPQKAARDLTRVTEHQQWDGTYRKLFLWYEDHVYVPVKGNFMCLSLELVIIIIIIIITIITIITITIIIL